MKLLSIEITNFRQFKGTHKLNLDTNGASNVIVIHGENGAGKTTLLNAFKWCFYGKTDFDSQSERLLNEPTIAQTAEKGLMSMIVTVEFEHDGLQHTAKRESVFRKDTGQGYSSLGEGAFFLSYIDKAGVFQDTENPTPRMSQILPEQMQPYFFFNGERIEKLAHVNAADQIRSAIKNLMGLEIVERAVQHLSGPVIARLRKDLKDTSSMDLQDAMDREAVMDQKVKETTDHIERLNENIRNYEEEQRLVNKALEANSEVSALNKERVSNETRAEELRTAFESMQRERKEFISSTGGLAFAQNMLTKAGEILAEKRKKGELPFKVKGQFIDDLLNQQRCICDRDLLYGLEPYQAVHAFKKSTTSDDVEAAFIETSGSIGHMMSQHDELFRRLKEFQIMEQDFVDQINRCGDRIDEIASKIGSRDCEDIADLETKRGVLGKQIIECAENRGKLTTELDHWNIKLDEFVKDRKRLSLQSERNGVATRRLQLAEEAKRILMSFNRALAEQVRKSLSKRVHDTFGSIMRKPYWAEISEDYTLEIYKNVGGEKQLVYDKSTGESQITSLAFVGSIISLAKERAQSGSQSFRGGVFPIVMDSPFGALDPDYRSKIAESIPELAEQVIIMVSASQWKGEVAAQIQHRKAREYTLSYSKPKPSSSEGGDIENDSEKFEYTEIKEGFHVD